MRTSNAWRFASSSAAAHSAARAGSDEIDIGRRHQLQAQLRAHDGDRPADEAGDVLGAERGEGVDGPQGRVDRAQQRRERALRRLGVGQRLAGARRGIGRDQPGREVGQRRLRRREAVAAAPASAGPSRPAAISQVTPPLVASCSSSPTGLPSIDEDLEALVEVIGQQEAGHRVDRQRRLDLVDARLGAFGADRRARLDPAQQPARRPQQARRIAERLRPRLDPRARRRARVGERRRGHIEQPAERIDQARALQT